MTFARSPLLVGLLVALTAGPVGAADPCHDPSSESHSTHACKVTRLRERPFVVIATVDTGINPYHEDFRLPADDDMQGVHPSEYIDGYPASTQALNLTLDAPNLTEARAADAQAWEGVPDQELRWIPGTNIIGGYSGVGSGGLFDQEGHGTGVASIAGGRLYGKGGPNVLLVSVSGSDDGWAWAAAQPWIDLISISWTNVVPVVDGSAEASREAVVAGKIDCVATHNFIVPIWFSEAQGPSWNLNVGAVEAGNNVQYYSGAPADVVAFPDLPVATRDSLTATRTFSGTSGATPHTCAIIARVLSAARARLGDTTEGPHGGGLAVGPPGAGALSDGVLTRTEIEDAIQSSATPVSGPAHWVRAGYGIVSAATVQPALEVVFAERPRPARPDEDRWIETTDQARNVLYGEPPS